MIQSPFFWIALLVAINFFWAGSYVVIKLGLESMDPLVLVFWRITLALVVLLGWIKVRKLSFKGIPRRDFARIATAGLLLGLSSWLSVTGIDKSLATDASLLYVFEPIWGILLASIFLRERLRMATIIGLISVVVGLARLSNFDIGAFGLGQNLRIGNLLIVAGLFCEGLFSIVVKPAASRVAAPVICAGVHLFAMLVVGMALASRGNFSVPESGRALFALAYLAIICTVTGYTLWIFVMKRVSVSAMFFTIFVQPIAGPFIAALTLGEKIDFRVITGGAFLLAGMAIAVWGCTRKQRTDVVLETGGFSAIGP